MRTEQTRSGDVLVYDDDNEDFLVIEPYVCAYIPTLGNSGCVCGAQLSLRPCTEGGAELSCHRCHRVHGHISVAARIHR
jgi:hypothetical protein